MKVGLATVGATTVGAAAVGGVAAKKSDSAVKEIKTLTDKKKSITSMNNLQEASYDSESNSYYNDQDYYDQDFYDQDNYDQDNYDKDYNDPNYSFLNQEDYNYYGFHYSSQQVVSYPGYNSYAPFGNVKYMPLFSNPYY